MRGSSSHRAPPRALASALLAAALLTGCEGVPTLRFAADSLDGGPDTSGDGPADDGANSCPDHPPSGTTACCSTIPCTGDCDAHCGDCLSRCPAVGSVCCVGASVVCHASGFACK